MKKPVKKNKNQLLEEINSLGIEPVKLEQLTGLLNDFLGADSKANEENSKEDVVKAFNNFKYFPGIVLAFDSDNKVVFQNKPILGKANITGQYLPDILRFLNSPALSEEADKVWHTKTEVKTSLINPINLKAIDVFINHIQFNGDAFLLAFIEDINLPAISNHERRLVKVDKQREAVINDYKIIANSISDIFFILDKDLKFTFAAPSIERVLQYSFNELLGQGFDILIPEWSGNTLKKNLDTVLALRPNISEPQRFTIQLSSKYGQLTWYEVQITGIYSDNGELQGYNGVCRDITERLKYEEALRLAKKKAEESDRLKSAFLANMSHEIRTPLNGIIGFSTMLTNKFMPDEKKERYTDYIISSSKQLLTLISDIIDISKIEAGQLKIFKAKVDIIKLLNELRETINLEKDRLEKNEVRTRLIVPIREEISFVTDEVRLKQVLINMLFNALKFTQKGKVEFGCEFRDKCNIRFFVRDSGEGIPQNLQKTVFERFRQGNVDNNATVAGTGLGLAISKGLINLMGGEIGVKSQEGVGSEFYFTLPYIQE